jgi:hypothetical protein
MSARHWAAGVVGVVLLLVVVGAGGRRNRGRKGRNERGIRDRTAQLWCQMVSVEP